jgi:hypothetical protein
MCGDVFAPIEMDQNLAFVLAQSWLKFTVRLTTGSERNFSTYALLGMKIFWLRNSQHV